MSKLHYMELSSIIILILCDLFAYRNVANNGLEEPISDHLSSCTKLNSLYKYSHEQVQWNHTPKSLKSLKALLTFSV
uniref:LRR receptor-like serine/threonine-protein kinase ERECTA n=1 Tax=Noccaea caerulescens TaxID=107243 RepID=A0A1J3GHL9_NOCCA